MSGAVKGVTKLTSKLLGGLLDVDEPEQVVPEKTDKQKKDEAAAEAAARQEELRTEREKASRKKGKSGRQALTYRGPSQIGINNSKLGGGL